MSVSALLAANALVLVLAFGDDDPEPTVAPATITYIVAEDGSVIAVDPNTPEGWRAIQAANERGQDVVTVAEEDAPDSVRAVTTTTVRSSSTTRPGSGSQFQPSGGGPGVTLPTIPDVDQLLDDTLTTVVETVDELGETIDGTVDDVTDLVDDTTGLDTGSTVDPVVDDTTDTLTTTVSTVADTVSETTPPVEVPDVPLPSGVTDSTPEVPGGLLP